jgi:alpha-beta hydrolase superfamily lysophospholipase
MRHETGAFTGRGGLTLFRQAWLPDAPSRAVLINLHGLGDHSTLYPMLPEYFVPRGIAVHAFDLRGHGRSEGQRAYLDDWRDYRDDLDTFIGMVPVPAGRRPFLLGHSLGGLVALDYALHMGSRLAGVIAAAPALGDVGVPRVLMAAGRVLSRIWPRFSMRTGMDLSALSREPEARQAVVDDPLFHRVGTARLSTEVVAAIERVQRLAPTLAVPVLLLQGGADRMVSPEGTRKFFGRLTVADRELIEYPDAYHALLADLDAPKVLGDLGRWIDARAG